MDCRSLRLTVVLASSICWATQATGQSLPDLSLTHIEFCSASGACAEKLSSDEETFVRVTLNNVGVQDTKGAAVVSLSVGDAITMTSSRAAGLGVGESLVITFNVGRLAPGAYPVSFVTDSKQEIAELDDTNNAATRTLTIIARAVAGVAPTARRPLAANHIPTAAVAVTAVVPEVSLPTATPAITPTPVEQTIIAVPVDAQPVEIPPVESQPIESPRPQPVELVAATEDQVPVEESRGMVPEAARRLTARSKGWISGRVTANGSGDPLAGIGVGIYGADGELIDWRTTDGAGSYTSGDLLPGEYRVVAHRNAGWQDTIVGDMPITKYARARIGHGDAGAFSFGFFNEQPQFWANGALQRGVMSLGDIRSTPLEVIVPPSADCASRNKWIAIALTSCYSRGAVHVTPGHTYVALSRRGDADGFIVFRVVDVQPGLWIDLEYLVTSGAARGAAVTVQNGHTTSGVDQALAPVPSIFGMTPAHGPAGGGTVVAITGTNFQPGAVVTFAGMTAGEVDVVSSTLIVATVPAAAGGAADVEVWNRDGSSALAMNGYRYDGSAPGAFTKVFAGSAEVTDELVALRWQPSANVIGYYVCIDAVDDNHCTAEGSPTLGWVAVGDATIAAWPRWLFAQGTTYYWQVRALNTNGFVDADAGNWSRFSAGPPRLGLGSGGPNGGPGR